MKRFGWIALLLVVGVSCGEGDDKKSGTNNATTPTTTGPDPTTNNDTGGDTTGTSGTTGTTGTTGGADIPHNPDANVGDSCFANFECNLGQRCAAGAQDAEETCQLGERGTGETGDPCDSKESCASGVCIGRNDGPEICTEECDPEGAACPAGLECVWIPYTTGDEHWCVTPNE